MALELAIAGNIIDYGIKGQLDIQGELKNILQKEHSLIKKEKLRFFNYPGFKKSLKRKLRLMKFKLSD